MVSPTRPSPLSNTFSINVQIVTHLFLTTKTQSPHILHKNPKFVSTCRKWKGSGPGGLDVLSMALGPLCPGASTLHAHQPHCRLAPVPQSPLPTLPPKERPLLPRLPPSPAPLLCVLFSWLFLFICRKPSLVTYTWFTLLFICCW